MTDNQHFWAYIVTLGALLSVVIGAMVIAGEYPDLIGKIEAFGLGTVTGGLIGILRLPRQSSIGPNENVTLKEER